MFKILFLLVIFLFIGCNEKEKYVKVPNVKPIPKKIETNPEPISTDPIFAKNYEEAIEISKNKPLLVIFSADWCGPCKKLKQEINQFDLTNYVVCFVNGDERTDLTNKYNVDSYPTSIILKKEKIIDKKIGYSTSSFSNWINNNK